MGRGLLAIAVLLVAAIGFGAWTVLGSLPKISGEVRIANPSLSAPVTVGRDGAGVVTITAQSEHDAHFALGFVHAQDRLFQMELMRRLVTGRLSELFGLRTLKTDKLMRLLGLAKQAEAQYEAASPDLRAALDAYAAGVNAYLDWHSFPLPPEFLLLQFEPEPWRPADSLLWGRLMAWQLSGNGGQEIENERIRRVVNADLLPLLLREESKQVSLPGLAPTRSASNNWVIAGARTASGSPILANDPHLSLTAPETWYMARLSMPDDVRVGATVPGIPFLVIGSNGHVAWGFSTTHSDTQDLFEEHLSHGLQDHYDTPSGPVPFEVRREVIKVKGNADVTFKARWTRHGPLISDLEPERYLHRRFSLAWTGFLPSDRTPEAFVKMNHARNAAEFKEALRDFHTPQQNVVFADTAGNIGFVAAGRVPVRQNISNESLFPAPGWIDDYAWTGTLSFDDLPQIENPPDGTIITANNDIRPPRYFKFLGLSFDRSYRRDHINSLLEQTPKATLEDMQRIQLDDFSGPLFNFVKTNLPDVKPSVPIDIAAAMSGWNGHMVANRPEPLIATAWLYATARRILADEMGGETFKNWWFWQVDILKDVMSKERWCDDRETPTRENCRDILRAGFAEALEALRARYGADWRSWSWGSAHEVQFRHPVFASLPYIGSYLVPKVAAPGDQFTINRGGVSVGADGARFADVHGPGMRLAVDLSRPGAPVFNLAGGQSGHPLSSHYSDLLPEWATGMYRTFQNPAEDVLILRPHQKKAGTEEAKP
ncbi:penicillin acylase family protein [Dongia deserti]|uniref:penicillin acylase family protein n=1 Tax=Dongia deserti TaxID=2268030 RepID=UPI0013C4F54A|nr:penicillin acylase family protein [Dongia deserti]